ncbi:aldo/keto reductase [Aquabacterium sp. OR-4]|uniref:aldo/keto reductase n=1 Tax=Aquabacterium sp. OR-4 TaxID=2978127 RepID=UPI0028C72BC9|nr:aldo/keto reductase [Aquabacterium sp. OR-4]MDT7838633.1 aldo/keto reductase [Aquabacterium sp. OR-4]
MGFTLIETAEAYRPFLSEKFIGEALQGIRDQMVLGTKFGFDIDPGTSARQSGGCNSQPEHIRRMVDAHLRSLRTDRIDVPVQHRVAPNVPIEDVASTARDLIGRGPRPSHSARSSCSS